MHPFDLPENLKNEKGEKKMNIRKISIGLLFLILALVVVPGAMAYNIAGWYDPNGGGNHVTSNPTPEVCGGCHTIATKCTTCHSTPFTLTIKANPGTVTAGTPSSVTFSVTRKNSAQAVSAATVALSGVAAGSGTTSSVGTALISFTATAGSITATASKTGYVSGTTNVVSNAASDNTPPVITVTGTNPVNINVGDTYVDAGATATDNVDKVVTVVTSGTVNTAIAGTYTLTYNAKDVAGNTAIPKTRTINVNAASDNTPPSTRKFSVTFIVTDLVTGKPVHDAKISMEGVTKETNRFGIAVFYKVSSENHKYQIKAEHYLKIEETINVIENMKKSVKLTPVLENEEEINEIDHIAEEENKKHD